MSLSLKSSDSVCLWLHHAKTWSYVPREVETKSMRMTHQVVLVVLGLELDEHQQAQLNQSENKKKRIKCEIISSMTQFVKWVLIYSSMTLCVFPFQWCVSVCVCYRGSPCWADWNSQGGWSRVHPGRGPWEQSCRPDQASERRYRSSPCRPPANTTEHWYQGGFLWQCNPLLMIIPLDTVSCQIHLFDFSTSIHNYSWSA